MTRPRLSEGLCRGAETAPVTPCVARPAGVASYVFRVVVRLDVGMFEEQAEDEGEDAPAGADRAWWAV